MPRGWGEQGRVRERLAFIAGADDMMPLRKMGVIATSLGPIYRRNAVACSSGPFAAPSPIWFYRALSADARPRPARRARLAA